MGRPAVQRLASRPETGRLHEDGGGGIMAEGETAAVYDADKGTVTTDLGHEGAFAKAHLPNTLAKSGFPGECAHPSRTTGGQFTERKRLRVKTIESGGGQGRQSQVRLSLTVNSWRRRETCSRGGSGGGYGISEKLGKEAEAPGLAKTGETAFAGGFSR